MTRAIQSHRKVNRNLDGWIFLITGSVATLALGLFAPMVVYL